MDNYKTIELDITDWPKESLITLIKYSVDNELTIEQSINRWLIISLIKRNKSYEPSKVKCVQCGKSFYGDVMSKCFRCSCAEDQDPVWQDLIKNPDDIQISIIESLDECQPIWMIVDENNEYLRP